MADYDLQYQDTHIDALLATANELKTAGYIYKGVATPSTNPGTPTERVAYLASEPGTYTNFGGIVITSGLYSLTYANGTWTGTQMSAGSDIEVVQTIGDSTTDVMSQKAVTDALIDTEKKELKDFSNATIYNFNLENNRTSWASSTSYKCIIVPRCLFGDAILFQPLTLKVSYAFLKYNNTKANTAVQFAGGMTHADTIQVGDAPKLVTIPNDCGSVYIYISNLSISTITTLFNIYSVSYIKDIVGQLIAPKWNLNECNEVKGGIMPSTFLIDNGKYVNNYSNKTTYTRAISRVPFKLEKGEWLKITMDSSVKAVVKSIDNNGYYLGDDTGNPQVGGTLIVKGDGNKKVIWSAFANDSNITDPALLLSHFSIVKGYDYRYEPTKISVAERFNTTTQSELIDNLSLCNWYMEASIPYNISSTDRCCSSTIEWIEDDILVSFPNTIKFSCYDMGTDKTFKGRASVTRNGPYIIKGGRYIILWFAYVGDATISSLTDFVSQISITNVSADKTSKEFVDSTFANTFNDTLLRKVFGIAKGKNDNSQHASIYTQMDFLNDYYNLTSYQSSPYNKEKGYILHLKADTEGNICYIDGHGQYPITLPSMGHENDAFIDGDEMWVVDGDGLGSGGFTDIYKYLFSTGTATKYTLNISSSVGATMVVGGICKYSDTELLIAAYDYRGNYNNEGDELRIYKMNKSTQVLELLFTTQWEGWFVQGMTYVNGFAYIAANMIPNGNVYTGINIWKIDMLGTPSLIETMQLFGDFEPEGLDSYSHNGIDYLLMGIGKYNAISQLTRMVAF